MVTILEMSRVWLTRACSRVSESVSVSTWVLALMILVAMLRVPRLRCIIRLALWVVISVRLHRLVGIRMAS